MFLRRSTLVLFSIILPCTTASAQPLPHSWSHRFGDQSEQSSWCIATDAVGNVLVTGSFAGTVDFGGGPLTSAGLNDIFVVKFAANGAYVWSRRFGDSSDQTGNSITADAVGNVLVTGSFAGTVDFGGGLLTSAGLDDIFVAKFAASGAHVWSRSFGDALSEDHGASIAVDGSGNAIVTGDFEGTVNFGGGPLASAGLEDIYMAKFDPNGAHIWSQRFGDSGRQLSDGVVVDAFGRILLAGLFGNTVDFGGGVLTSTGSADVFVARFDANGGHIWSRRFGDASFQRCDGLATDALGGVLVTGMFQGAVDFGGGPLTSAGGFDTYAAKFDTTGAHTWSRRFGDSDHQSGPDVAVDAVGNAYLTGYLTGTIDFGGGPLTSAGGADVFLAKFDPSGTHAWSQRFGDENGQGGNSIATDALGGVVVTGSLWGTADFGGGPLISAGGADIFVAKFGTGPVATLLRGFSARYAEPGIAIQWQLAETGLGMEFFILRSHGGADNFRELTNPDITASGLSFTFVDKTCEAGLAYRYRVDVSDEEGRRVLFETTEIATPELSFSLGRNFPNPFNPTTRVPFVIGKKGHVTLAVYDSSGRLVRTLAQRSMNPGPYSEEWDGRDAGGNIVSSGIYFLQLTADKRSLARKAVLLK